MNSDKVRKGRSIITAALIKEINLIYDFYKDNGVLLDAPTLFDIFCYMTAFLRITTKNNFSFNKITRLILDNIKNGEIHKKGIKAFKGKRNKVLDDIYKIDHRLAENITSIVCVTQNQSSQILKKYQEVSETLKSSLKNSFQYKLQFFLEHQFNFFIDQITQDLKKIIEEEKVDDFILETLCKLSGWFAGYYTDVYKTSDNMYFKNFVKHGLGLLEHTINNQNTIRAAGHFNS